MRASVLLLSLGLALALLLCVVSVEAGTRTTVQGGGGVASKRRYTWKDEDAILLSVVTPETLSAHQAAQAQKQKQAPSAAGYVLHAANKAPKSPSPNGLNFTVYKYPTKQGLVNIFVGITEYPLGKLYVDEQHLLYFQCWRIEACVIALQFLIGLLCSFISFPYVSIFQPRLPCPSPREHVRFGLLEEPCVVRPGCGVRRQV
jgi:hypothetical protein